MDGRATRTIGSERVECILRPADQLGETPLWCDRTHKLWWIDIEKPKLQSFDPFFQFHEIFPDREATFLGSQALTQSGGHLLARDLSLVARAPDGTLAPFA